MDRTLYVDRYYMTEVDTFEDSIYCHHALMGENFISEHSHTKGQFLYAERGIVFLKTSEKSYVLPARHYMWIPGGIKHSIYPSSPEVVMRNLYFPAFATDGDFFNEVSIYPVNDFLIEFIMFTNRWTGNIFPTEEPKFSIAKAFKLILPEVSQTELPLALPYPKDEKLKLIVNYLEQRIDQNISFKKLANEFELSERTLARLFQRELNMSFIQYYTILRMLTALKLIVNQLEQRIDQNIRVKQLANEFEISERALSRLFQRELNMSFIQYYTILRMLTALKLLFDEKMSVNDVSMRVGYSSLPTFSNTFYKVIGVRPSEYIKNKNLLL